LNELILQDGKIGIAFLKDVGTKRETNGNVITSMGFRLRGLDVRIRRKGGVTVDVVGTEIWKFGFLAIVPVPFASVEVPFVRPGGWDLSP
jgi:hypothetical protein